ncbi:2OG-Fe(II) oxygenase [Roseateles koreensis]|uniref:2OG-Fe(II) oxygenase n=1 Tax=Roseateles koreensis TaxID=2987526 RepID=A0ABT5KN56_9BURK|nr:2OG-Fe(II) oxygenase [Roseateles koreensis]MDC8783845.1 2OG-Fe(II) oxygenase [Roseateles koreensis]
MSTQLVTVEVRRWIAVQFKEGHDQNKILAALRASGWDADVAEQAVQAVLGKQGQQPGLKRFEAAQRALPPSGRLPEPDLTAERSECVVEGHTVKVLLTLAQPRIVVFGGLLSDEECDALVARARPRMSRSETVADTSVGSEVNTARTSDGMFFTRGEDACVARIESRIAALLNWPVENGEGLQVLHYRPGAEYQPHYDYFDPGHVATPAILARGGQRVGTLVIYLNTPEAGGATVFPDIQLAVSPVKGNAVFFSYDQPDPGTQTLHGGAQVCAGEKWVATKWLREGEFI